MEWGNWGCAPARHSRQVGDNTVGRNQMVSKEESGVNRVLGAPHCPLCGDGSTLIFYNERLRHYHRCSQCLLTFMDAAFLPDIKAEKARYLEHNNDPQEESYRQFLSKLTEPLILNLRSGARGLDFGCGYKPSISVLMAESGYEMANYDPIFHPDKSVLEESYDYITCCETAEHFHAPAKEFDMLNSMLVSGGTLALRTEILDADEKFAGWWYRRDITHVSFYKLDTMIWLADHYGWQWEWPEQNIMLFHKD